MLGTCNTNDDDQRFSLLNGYIINRAGVRCLDVVGPSDAQFTNGEGAPGVGSPVQEVECNSSLNQRWNINGQIRYGANTTLCLNRSNGVDGNGNGLNLATCAANTMPNSAVAR